MTTASRSPPTHRALYPVVQLNLIFPARLSSRSQRAPGGFLSPTPAVGHLLSPPSSSLRYIKATSFFRPPLVRSSSSPLSPSLPRPSEEKTRPDENKEKCQGGAHHPPAPNNSHPINPILCCHFLPLFCHGHAQQLIQGSSCFAVT